MSKADRTLALYAAVVVGLVYVVVRRSRPATIAAAPSLRAASHDAPPPIFSLPDVVDGVPTGGTQTVRPTVAKKTTVGGRIVGVDYRFNRPVAAPPKTVAGRQLGVDYRHPVAAK